MTAATEPAGVSKVFPRQTMETLFKDRYFMSGSVTTSRPIQIFLSSYLQNSLRRLTQFMSIYIFNFLWFVSVLNQGKTILLIIYLLKAIILRNPNTYKKLQNANLIPGQDKNVHKSLNYKGIIENLKPTVINWFNLGKCQDTAVSPCFSAAAAS